MTVDTGSAEDGVFGDFTLRAGWNEILLKLVRDESMPPFAAHFTHSDRSRLFSGLVDAEWTRFPWD